MASYPSTKLLDGQQDPDFGGQPANRFGAPALAWINSVLMFLQAAYFKFAAVPHNVRYVRTDQACAAGDVLAFFPDNAPSGGGYMAKPAASAPGNIYFVGVALEPASAGAYVRVANGGIVPASVTGIAPAAGSDNLGYTGHRLRRAVAGDTVIGVVDANGNAYLFATDQL